MPAKHQVQFALHQGGQTLLIPAKPITIPAGSFGWWPVNLDCAGVMIRYATVEPLCHVQHGSTRIYIFGAIRGIPPQMAIARPSHWTLSVAGGAVTHLGGGLAIYRLPTGPGAAIHAVAPTGQHVIFIILTPSEAQHLWKLRIGSVRRAVLSPDALVPSLHHLELLRDNGGPVSIALLPAPTHFAFNGRTAHGQPDGAFTRYVDIIHAPAVAPITCTQIQRANLSLAAKMYPMIHSNWNTAAVPRWRVTIPKEDKSLPLLVKIYYVGNVLRVYAGGKLLVDDFYNGKPLDFPLGRVAPGFRSRIELRMLPLFRSSPITLPPRATPNFRTHRDYAVIKRIEPLLECHVTCTATGTQ